VYSKAGALLLFILDWRPLRTNWLIVGTLASEKKMTNGCLFPSREAIDTVHDGLALLIDILPDPRNPCPAGKNYLIWSVTVSSGSGICLKGLPCF
jgi:hypothetical protein